MGVGAGRVSAGRPVPTRLRAARSGGGAGAHSTLGAVAWPRGLGSSPAGRRDEPRPAEPRPDAARGGGGGGLSAKRDGVRGGTDRAFFGSGSPLVMWFS